MQDFINSLHLADVREFLLSGQPPLLVQLLALNTVVMIIFIVRRARGKGHERLQVTYALQWILIGGIVGVIMEDHWLPYVDHSRMVITDRYNHVVNP